MPSKGTYRNTVCVSVLFSLCLSLTLLALLPLLLIVALFVRHSLSLVAHCQLVISYCQLVISLSSKGTYRNTVCVIVLFSLCLLLTLLALLPLLLIVALFVCRSLLLVVAHCRSSLIVNSSSHCLPHAYTHTLYSFSLSC